MCSTKVPNTRRSTVPTRKAGSTVIAATSTGGSYPGYIVVNTRFRVRCRTETSVTTQEKPMPVRLRDVADHAGVSVKTVSNVVNGYAHVSAATRERVEASLAQLDYHANMSARSLRTGRSGVIALAVPALDMPYF